MKNDFMKKNKRKIIVIPCIIIAVFIISLAVFNNMGSSKKVSAVTGLTQKVVKGSIKVEISGSGVIEPVQRYDITSMVSGNIISAPFEEGQAVKKEDILYKFDATELEGNIQKSKNNIEKLRLNDSSTRESLDKTVVYAGASGNLINFTVKENETAGGNKLGEIVDENYCIARVPFSKSQVSQIKAGQLATVNSEVHMSSIAGTVLKISSMPTSQKEGVALYDVDIKLQGYSSSLFNDTGVTAVIGSMESPEAGKIYAPEAYSITSALSGRVSKVYVSNNDYVAKGEKLFELDKESYADTLKKSSLDQSDANLSLKAQLKQLENYNIKSPIDGVVLKKNSKAGDTITSGMNASPLMVVADMTKVKFTMKIDELDIAKIKLGQPVKITADALPNKIFDGSVTSIAGEGTASNGVSNYEVQVTINEPGELKSGMNITAKIIVAEKNNALLVPAAAVQKKDGKSFVTLPTGESGKQNSVNVEIGINNKDYIEIVQGLKEGDTVVMPTMAETREKASGFGPQGGGGPNGMDAMPR